MKTPRAIEKTFALAVPAKNGCIELKINRTPSGYGRIRVGEKKVIASRFVWELKNGKIPDGILVLHRCDNPACINIKHLFLGTQKDNIQDCMKKGRFRGIENSPFVLGHHLSAGIGRPRKMRAVQ